ncbi:MAG: GGDEF domain-containing protein [Planctomycetaceae bacterium]|nr:GGDEF domain-containing protein [Planctomycetaceae bacterium]
MFQLPETKTDIPYSGSRQPECANGACIVRIYPAGVGGSLFALDKPAVRLGRGSDCECELPDDYTSRHHCKIEWRGDRHVLTDLNSLNGTFVNDVRVTTHELKPGDQIRLGFHIFKYLASNHVEAMYHEAVFEMMTIDALTQTYNRRYFEDAFQREVLRSSRHARQLGLLLMDLDHFKQVNDKYGHLIGDELLTGFCRRIKVRVRGDEVLARFGGEEFALAAVEISRDDLLRLAEDLRDLVASKPFETSKGAVSLTMSIGAAHSSGLDLISPKEMLDAADQKLYEAKSAGRNQVCF